MVTSNITYIYIIYIYLTELFLAQHNSITLEEKSGSKMSPSESVYFMYCKAKYRYKMRCFPLFCIS